MRCDLSFWDVQTSADAFLDGEIANLTVFTRDYSITYAILRIVYDKSYRVDRSVEGCGNIQIEFVSSNKTLIIHGY